MDEHLTTRQVASALSVSESSVKRWCDRGVIPTVRTVGGHRRVPMSGFMRFLEDTNRQVVTPLPGLDRMSHATRPGPECGDTEVEVDIDQLKRQFAEAIAAGDETTCRDILVGQYQRTGKFSKLADEFVAATFHELGEQWDCGNLEVYQERRGCEICSRILHECRRIIPPAHENAPLAIGGSPEGDHYTMPSQLVELVLREASWRSINMGSNLPLSTLAAAVAEHKPRMLWISASHIEDRGRFIEAYNDLCDAVSPETMVVIGGRALTDGLRPQLRYTGHCDNMEQLSSFAIALHGKRHAMTTSQN